MWLFIKGIAVLVRRHLYNKTARAPVKSSMMLNTEYGAYGSKITTMEA